MKKKTVAARFTSSAIHQYLTCPLQLYFSVHGGRRKGPESAAFALLREQGISHERRIAARMGFAAKTVNATTEAAALAQTLALMKKGVPIYQGSLAAGNWFGRPDFLLPKRGASRLGKHHYVIADVKLAQEVTDEHKLQMVFYTLLLEKIQGVRPKTATIINGTGKEVRIVIEDVLPRFEEVFGAIEKIFAGEKPPPFFSGACKESGWFRACQQEAAASNDLSLLHKVWRAEYDRLRAVGITTVKQLARTSPEQLKERVAGISAARLIRLHQEAIVYLRGKHWCFAEPRVPAASVEIYYDVETDMAAHPPMHYLHGVLMVKRAGKRVSVKYRAFLVRNPKQEATVWKSFVRFVLALPEDAVFYHFGRYEQQVIAELTARYGTPREALVRFGKMIDLSRVVAGSMMFPTSFYSLKDIAKYLSFQWRHKAASGANSIQWYQEWRDRSKSAVHRQRMQRDIVEYNEDDVRATYVLKTFLATCRPDPSLD